jgi:hypothetical protein
MDTTSGCLKHSAYKWLDVKAIAENVLSNLSYARAGVPVSAVECCV